MATTDTTLIDIKQYTKDLIPDVLQFERDLRSEENFWGWEIDEKYIADVTQVLKIQPLQIPYPCLLTWMEKSWAGLTQQRFAVTLTVPRRHT